MILKSLMDPIVIPEVDVAAFIIDTIDQSPYWQDPQRPVYIDAKTGETVTIGEMVSNATAIASGWQSVARLPRGAVVALLSPNDVHYAVALLSVTLAGGIATPVNPAYTVDELVHQLKDSGTTFIVADRDFLEIAGQAASKVGIAASNILALQPHRHGTSTKSLYDLRCDRPVRRLSLHRDEVHTTAAYLCYSSGTTGRSKGVETTHYNVVANVCQVRTFNRLMASVQDDRYWIGILPFYHIYGLHTLLHLNLVQGCPVVSMRKFDMLNFLESVPKYRINYAHLVPPIILWILRHPAVKSHDLSSLVGITCGAAPLPLALAKEFGHRFSSIALTEGYGMTELSPVSHMAPRESRYVNSIGVLMPNTEARFVDDSGRVLGYNQTGELCIRGPQVMKGYLNNPEATRATVDSKGFLHTGDVGHVNEDGYFFISDRKKELIKYKGFQVAPAELEALVITHPQVQDVAVIGMHDHEHVTEVPKAFVVSADPSLVRTEVDQRTLAADIVQFVNCRVANHKRLRGGVEFVSEIPRSATGKILRRVLRNQEQANAKRLGSSGTLRAQL
ncbi:hypothetical protein IWQ60_009024 [Tieghemiomyces parasiticus]|uniref:Uncharacterized protein n=1 Tax=Tieghemiomyces parasiticus TaxID=78921 RepID=A0A9W8DQ58_9FUNG|nr:hypothetical protein IWQ60_009024 [Tieghemiomyces parasiticus]